jgi:hypothetical protein
MSSVIGLPRGWTVVANPSLARRSINGHRHHPGCYGAVEGAQPAQSLQSSYTTSRDATLEWGRKRNDSSSQGALEKPPLDDLYCEAGCRPPDLSGDISAMLTTIKTADKQIASGIVEIESLDMVASALTQQRAA